LTCFTLFGLGFLPPWYWDPAYWGPWYYGRYWRPWFNNWTTAYVPYPYYDDGIAVGRARCGKTGIKFDADAITDGTDKKVIRETEVTVDSKYAGIVKNYEGRKVLELEAGDHTVEVRLANNQSFTKTVEVRPCQVTVISIPQPPHPTQKTPAGPTTAQPTQQSGNAAGNAPAPSAQLTDEQQLQQLQQLRQETVQENKQIEDEIDKKIRDLQRKIQKE